MKELVSILAAIATIIAVIFIGLLVLFMNYILIPLVALILLGVAAYKITKENYESETNQS